MARTDDLLNLDPELAEEQAVLMSHQTQIRKSDQAKPKPAPEPIDTRSPSGKRSLPW